MPLFAFCNAGIIINFSSAGEHLPIFIGVIMGLLVGKPLGIFLLSYASFKLKIAKKPNNINTTTAIINPRSIRLNIEKLFVCISLLSIIVYMILTSV